MINKKVMIVPESLAVKVSEMLEERDVWDCFDMVVVRDEDFDEASKEAEKNMPEGKRMYKVKVNEQDR